MDYESAAGFAFGEKTCKGQRVVFRHGDLSLSTDSREDHQRLAGYHDRSFEKTHDLRLLVMMASEIEPKFTAWFDVAEQVTPYATAYRYPGEVLEPTKAEYAQAFKAASEFYQFVCLLLPADISLP